MDWIHLSQNRKQRVGEAFMDMEMNFVFHKIPGGVF